MAIWQDLCLKGASISLSDSRIRQAPTMKRVLVDSHTQTRTHNFASQLAKEPDLEEPNPYFVSAQDSCLFIV